MRKNWSDCWIAYPLWPSRLSPRNESSKLETSNLDHTQSDPLVADPWDRLSAELDAWAAINQVATFWWRDDDATIAGPKLDRLFDLTATAGLLLAVIPSRAQHCLASAVNTTDHVQVGQHGYSHTNYAERGQGNGAWELGLHREMAVVLSELEAGREHLETLFGQRFISVVIPPWNHIDPILFNPLAMRGFRGVSLFGSDGSSSLPKNFIQVNAHCDPIKWKNGARFTGQEKAVNQLITHLRARRTGAVAADEATGILTHHIDLDEASWEFCVRTEQILSHHCAARWCDASKLFEVDL